MASTFSKLRDELEDDLEAQIKMLRREVSSLKKSLGKRGAAAYDDGREQASELYDDLLARFNDAIPHLAKQSRVVQQAAKDNPVATAVVGVAVVGLLLSLLARR